MHPDRPGPRPAWRSLRTAVGTAGAGRHSRRWPNDLEAKVEAAYLYHLTKFVDWPGLPANEVRICVLGSDAVGSMMARPAGPPGTRPCR